MKKVLSSILVIIVLIMILFVKVDNKVNALLNQHFISGQQGYKMR